MAGSPSSLKTRAGELPPAKDGGASEGSGEAAPGRWPQLALLGTLLVGLGLATHLTRTHLELVYGDGSFDAKCDFGSGFSCSDVITSSYATLFGVLPWSLLAIPAYAAMLMLVLRSLSLKDRNGLGLLALLGLFSTVLSIGLFYVSSVLIGAYCPFCMGMYAVNLSAMLLPMIALREKPGPTLKIGLSSLRSPKLVSLAAANFLVVGAIAAGGYSSARAGLIQASKDRAVEQLKAGGANPASSPVAGGSPTSSPSTDQKSPPRPAPGSRQTVPIDDTIPFIGNPKAPVTIIAYEDFQCGFCKRLAGNLEQLVERHPEDVRVGYRHFPMNLECNGAGIKKSMHPDACRAAVASECARQQGQFWPYHDLLFKHQRNLSSRDLSGYAQDLKLDGQAFQQCQQNPATLEKIRNDSRTGGELGVSGTPTFFVNGRTFSGAQSVEVLSALVMAEKAGQELSVAELRNVALEPDITGTVKAPETVRLEGPYGPFEIDTFEASIVNGKAQSKAGIQASTNVSWFDANAACQAVGKRLCTEAEWLTACTGAQPVDENGNGDFVDEKVRGTAYPYGDFYTSRLCHDRFEPPPGTPRDAEIAPPPLLTGNHPECKSASGVYDLTGNAREWIGTVAADSAFIGGAFYSGDSATCMSRNESVGPFYAHEATGFRCCKGGNPPTMVRFPGRQVGETLKPFKGTLSDGKPFDSKSLKGKLTLITFWASWCGPCRQELPGYVSVYPELEKKGFRILAVNVDEDPDKAIAFMQKIPLNFPVLMDTDNALLRSFDTRAMPTSFLVDEEGRILMRRTGFEKGDEERLQNTVEKHLARKG